jgi:anti-sigma factor RsiW
MSGHTERPGTQAEISRETMMRYLDGELAPEERREFEVRLEASTELQRELALYRTLHEDLSGIRIRGNGPNRSVWTSVHRRLTRPVGWILIVLGVLAWLSHAGYVFMTAPTPTWEKLATSAVVIGVLLLFASVIHERWQELATDPYRYVER